MSQMLSNTAERLAQVRAQNAVRAAQRAQEEADAAAEEEALILQLEHEETERKRREAEEREEEERRMREEAERLEQERQDRERQDREQETLAEEMRRQQQEPRPGSLHEAGSRLSMDMESVRAQVKAEEMEQPTRDGAEVASLLQGLLLETERTRRAQEGAEVTLSVILSEMRTQGQQQARTMSEVATVLSEVVWQSRYQTELLGKLVGRGQKGDYVRSSGEVLKAVEETVAQKVEAKTKARTVGEPGPSS